MFVVKAQLPQHRIPNKMKRYMTCTAFALNICELWFNSLHVFICTVRVCVCFLLLLPTLLTQWVCCCSIVLSSQILLIIQMFLFSPWPKVDGRIERDSVICITVNENDFEAIHFASHSKIYFQTKLQTVREIHFKVNYGESFDNFILEPLFLIFICSCLCKHSCIVINGRVRFPTETMN